MAEADKAGFRLEVKALEGQIPQKKLLESDKALQEKFLALPLLEMVDTVLLFAGMGREIDTQPLLDALLARGKTVLLPRCLPGHGMEARTYDPHHLVRHRYGMLEPEENCPVWDKGKIDLILVPGLCYDRQCFRMGRGGGYYDRYLAGFGGRTVGLCRDVLLQDAVPREDWDRPVDLVLTETRCYARTERRNNE